MSDIFTLVKMEDGKRSVILQGPRPSVYKLYYSCWIKEIQRQSLHDYKEASSTPSDFNTVVSRYVHGDPNGTQGPVYYIEGDDTDVKWTQPRNLEYRTFEITRKLGGGGAVNINFEIYWPDDNAGDLDMLIESWREQLLNLSDDIEAAANPEAGDQRDQTWRS